MIDANSEDNMDNESETEDTSHLESGFHAYDITVEDLDTSTLRSHSSSMAEAKIFPQFKSRQGQQSGPKDITKGTDTPFQYLQLFWDVMTL